MPDLHTALEAAITARLEVARAAGAAKPGEWRAVPTHDGWEYDGHSRVLAEEPTATGRICRGVAHQITDDLSPKRSSLGDPAPPAAVVAEYIALHDPADAVRRYERDLGLIERYRRLDAEPVGRLTHEEILEHYGQLELLRELIDDLLDVYPEVLAAVDQTAPSSPLETPHTADGGEAGVVEGAGGSEAAEAIRAQANDPCRCGHLRGVHTWRGRACQMCYGCPAFEEVLTDA